MNDMKLRLVDHSAYNVEYVEDDTLTIAVALVSCLITILFDLIMKITAHYTIEVNEEELHTLHSLVSHEIQTHPITNATGPLEREHNEELIAMELSLREHMPHDNDEPLKMVKI